MARLHRMDLSHPIVRDKAQQVCLPAFLPACLPAFLSYILSFFLPNFLPVFLFFFIPFFLPSFLSRPSFLSAYLFLHSFIHLIIHLISFNTTSAPQVSWVTIHRVCGEISVSRSIGDPDYKSFSPGVKVDAFFAWPDDHDQVYSNINLFLFTPSFILILSFYSLFVLLSASLNHYFYFISNCS